jgi:hypothetical protein
MSRGRMRLFSQPRFQTVTVPGFGRTRWPGFAQSVGAKGRLPQKSGRISREDQLVEMVKLTVILACVSTASVP